RQPASLTSSLAWFKGGRSEHAEIKSMILTRQQTEGDDDQALDEFFEDMMQTVLASFTAEERDLLPLLARSLDS
ncbi:MAG: hypothetical protein ABI988_10470, partial [Nitrospirota bacterium]